MIDFPKLPFAWPQSEVRAYRARAREARRNIDGAPKGQRRHRTDAGRRHQTAADWIAAHRVEQDAGQIIPGSPSDPRAPLHTKVGFYPRLHPQAAMIPRHGRDGPQPDLVLRHRAVFPPGRRLLFEEGRGRGGPSRQAGRAPERQHLAWPGRGCPGIASRQAGRGGRLREASSGPCDRDVDSARAPARRTARAPPGLRHHVFGPEVGVAGGASADGGAPARRPRGHSRAQCGGARDARLDRGDTAGDPGLGPRHRQAAAGEGALDGGRAVPPHRKPQPRSAAPHSCGDRQHDPGRRGGGGRAWSRRCFTAMRG